MKTRKIKCGSRHVTIQFKAPALLAWLHLNDLGSRGSFAMSADTCDKIIRALTVAAAELRRHNPLMNRAKKRPALSAHDREMASEMGLTFLGVENKLKRKRSHR